MEPMGCHRGRTGEFGCGFASSAGPVAPLRNTASRPATRWSLDELAVAIVNEARHRAMSRPIVWRVPGAADLKPHTSVSWLNNHDSDL